MSFTEEVGYHEPRRRPPPTAARDRWDERWCVAWVLVVAATDNDTDSRHTSAHHPFGNLLAFLLLSFAAAVVVVEDNLSFHMIPLVPISISRYGWILSSTTSGQSDIRRTPLIARSNQQELSSIWSQGRTLWRRAAGTLLVKIADKAIFVGPLQ
jgi:hypothetical protein